MHLKNLLAFACLMTASAVLAQESSLYRRDQSGGIPLSSSSLIYSDANHSALLPKFTNCTIWSRFASRGF